MAAISYPSSDPRPGTGPHAAPRLRLIQGGRAAPTAPGVYSRRRLMALVVLVVLAAGLVTATRAVASALVVRPPAAPVAPAAPEATGGATGSALVHVVQPGDTVWSIARSLDADGDVRATVDRLVARNGGATLQVGQRLVLD